MEYKTTQRVLSMRAIGTRTLCMDLELGRLQRTYVKGIGLRETSQVGEADES